MTGKKKSPKYKDLWVPSKIAPFFHISVLADVPVMQTKDMLMAEKVSFSF